MILDIVGKLIQKLDIRSGESARGSWSVQDAVIETIEQYPKKICISFWGDKIGDLEKIKPGDKVTISVNLESREAGGRWYTSIRAWRVQFSDENASQQQTATTQPNSYPQDVPSPTTTDFVEDISESEIDDLPF
ncbi:MAG: DUF3127 domain-containing protein [Prevotellaceae bacterium]|jgi:homoaconitase/3-isopropylmalate dehydratase large subunit|nr:DUF3127 domain-containing protein [Prevotellaceae bacterium]